MKRTYFYVVEYRGFLQAVRREFSTRQGACKWLGKIGRLDLIPQIRRVPHT
jgi:hypothetical protein